MSGTEAFGPSARVGDRAGERTEQKAEWSGGFGNSAREPQRGSEVLSVWRRSLSRGSQSRQVFATGRAMGANTKRSSTGIPKPPVLLCSPISADCSLTGWPGRGMVRSLNGFNCQPWSPECVRHVFQLIPFVAGWRGPRGFSPRCTPTGGGDCLHLSHMALSGWAPWPGGWRWWSSSAMWPLTRWSGTRLQRQNGLSRDGFAHSVTLFVFVPG